MWCREHDELDLLVSQSRAPFLAPPVPSYLALGEFLDFSASQFPQLLIIYIRQVLVTSK